MADSQPPLQLDEFTASRWKADMVGSAIVLEDDGRVARYRDDPSSINTETNYGAFYNSVALLSAVEVTVQVTKLAASDSEKISFGFLRPDTFPAFAGLSQVLDSRPTATACFLDEVGAFSALPRVQLGHVIHLKLLICGDSRAGVVSINGSPVVSATLDAEERYFLGVDIPPGAACKILQPHSEAFAWLPRLWETKTFPDVEIVCESRRFEAHRAVLALASPVLSTMLSAGMREQREGEIRMDERPELIEHLLRYIYTGQLPSTQVAPSLLRIAHRYEMQDLVRRCCNEMIASLSEATVLTVRDTLLPLKDDVQMKGHWEAFCRGVENNTILLRTMLEQLPASQRDSQEMPTSPAALQDGVDEPSPKRQCRSLAETSAS
eukprot:TRINITY_DN103562_c0_g1_i1.p1 TRINITY_DN103562_c0_g1~~TRINITY_DN103562_c0_g1_i1.p1  ORF type:complete len:379 (+),score=25.96 TRINITY_DN103562_c0_g1_i1:82-1218(+)